MNYYNEFDPKTAAWLRELIAQKLIPAGDVDTRSIVDVCPDDLRAYTQCHFFAGIGGWSFALQLAGWPADCPVWTGSCPCQPFSTAGKQLGDKDERHLWPVFFNLIKECRPEYVFGEQVASAIGKGWLDGISTDLGEEGYACGSAVLGAHSVGSPHIRQRLYWVAHSTSGQCKELRDARDMQSEQSIQPVACNSASSGLAQPSDNGAGGGPREAGRCGRQSVDTWTESLRQAYGEAGSSWADSRSASSASGMADTEGEGRLRNGSVTERSDDEFRRHQERKRQLCESKPQGLCAVSGVGNPIMPRRETCDSISGGDESRPEQSKDSGAWSNVGMANTEHNRLSGKKGTSPIKGSDREDNGLPVGGGGQLCTDHWNNHTIIPCRDGKARRIPAQAIIEPVLQHVVDGLSCSLDARRNILSAAQGFPLAETIPGRVALLKGAGNAIVPQVAAEFIQAFNEVALQ